MIPKREKQITRRSFLRLAGLTAGAAALAPFLKACQSAGLTPTPQPAPTLPEPTVMTFQPGQREPDRC